MKVIQPNCRVQFSAADVDFIVATVARNAGDTGCLTALLTDVEARDQILDDPKLLHALLEHPGCMRVSAHLYFYVLVRQVFLRSGLTDRALADYVAEVLAEFSSAERTRPVMPGQGAPGEYFFEMLAALQKADDRSNFMIRAHIGNYSLFLSGVFPDRIRFRAASRGFPDLSYYEQLGITNFRVASDHRLARKCELSEVYTTLSERFRETRVALNDIADRLLSLGDPDYSLETLLGRGADDASAN